MQSLGECFNYLRLSAFGALHLKFPIDYFETPRSKGLKTVFAERVLNTRIQSNFLVVGQLPHLLIVLPADLGVF